MTNKQCVESVLRYLGHNDFEVTDTGFKIVIELHGASHPHWFLYGSKATREHIVGEVVCWLMDSAGNVAGENRTLPVGFALIANVPGESKHWHERGHQCSVLHLSTLRTVYGSYSWHITTIRTGEGVGGFSETFEQAIQDAKNAIDKHQGE